MALVEMRWHDLATEAIVGEGFSSVILFPVMTDVGHVYDIERVHTMSNIEYARLHALERGYTHWFPVPTHDKEAEILERNRKAYQREFDHEIQWHKGFQTASENILVVLKELIPDKRNLLRLIEERFVNTEDE